jgi:hypothetical protein
MGGRYAGGGRSNSGNNLSASGSGGSGGSKATPTAVMRRADSSVSQGSRGAEDAAPTADAATKQRPSLKLLARTKPLDNALPCTATTQSSIFGGAKPRDETKFVAVAAEVAVETKTVAANDTSKDLTSGVAKMEISKSYVTAPTSDRHAVGNSKSIDNNGSKGSEATAAPAPENDEKEDNTAEPSKNSIERKDSRGGGGRGGGGRGRGGGKNRENGNGKQEGRRDSTRRPARGERVAGGRGRGGSEGRGEGRNNTSVSRNSKSTKNGTDSTSEKGKGKSGGVSSLGAAAGAGEVNPNSLPTMPTANETKKGPPKKVNSFAAFMDDSDSD